MDLVSSLNKILSDAGGYLLSAAILALLNMRNKIRDQGKDLDSAFAKIRNLEEKLNSKE